MVYNNCALYMLLYKQQCRGFYYCSKESSTIAGIIHRGQFSREEEPFVLRGLFAVLKFAAPTPPLYVLRVYFSRMKLNRE